MIADECLCAFMGFCAHVSMYVRGWGLCLDAFGLVKDVEKIGPDSCLEFRLDLNRRSESVEI